MNKASIEISLKNIEKIFSSLILSTNYSYSDDVFSWNRYNSGIIKGVSYPREYQILVDTGQYSFLLTDGSFFQFYFEFHENNLKIAKLAFYPVPKSINESIEKLYEYEENANLWLKDVYADMLLELEFNSGILTSNSHIRFDYDKNTKSHSKSHLQFGAINNLRITSDAIVLPLIFFNKIIHDFFDDWYEKNINPDKIKSEITHSINKSFRFDEREDFYITIGR